MESRLWRRMVENAVEVGAVTQCGDLDAPGCHIVGDEHKFLVCEHPTAITIDPDGYECHRIYYDPRACTLIDDKLYCDYAIKMPVEECMCPSEYIRRRKR
ncbi:MAG: hypothetical protein ACXQS2_01695 [Methermicoccaceae archaeon]